MVVKIIEQLRGLAGGLLEGPLWKAAQIMQGRFRDDHLGQAAGALTFTTIIALVPLCTVVLAILTAFPAFGQFETVLERWLVESLIPDGIARQVMGYLNQFSAKASQLGAVGFAALIYSAVTLIYTIDHSLNSIWQVRRQRPWGQRILLYWAAITLGPLILAASVVLMEALVPLLGGSINDPTSLLRRVLNLLESGVTVAGFTALYHFVPYTRVRFRHALVGGIFTGVVLAGARHLLTAYMVNMGSYSAIYGAFATLPLLLLWIYIAWVIVLLGAVLVASLPGLIAGGDFTAATPGRNFELALAVIRQLRDSRASPAHGADLPQLAKHFHADPRQLEGVVETLVGLDWVGTLEEHAPGRPPRHVLLADPATTPLAPLMQRYLLAESPATATLSKKWQDWSLDDAL